MWKTRFQTPALDDLLSGMPQESRSEIEIARSKLGRASVKWRGMPWHWTISMNHSAGEVFLVPDPESPRMVACIQASFFAENPLESLPKPTRDLLRSAVRVGDGVWTEWSLEQPGSAELALDAVGLG